MNDAVEFKIEKGIPIPGKNDASGLGAAIKKMEIGDSVIWLKDRTSVGRYFETAFGPNSYTSRKELDGRIRVWRKK